MIRNYFLINLLLITIIAFLCVEFYKVVNRTDEIPSINTVKMVSAPKKDSKRRGERKINYASFNAITKKDLFRPSRTESTDKNSNEEKVMPQNAPKLFGTIILNNLKTAILEDPDTTLLPVMLFRKYWKTRSFLHLMTKR